jgi:hypothetical protein
MNIPLMEYESHTLNREHRMKCEIEITEVFYTWWMSLSENQQERIAAAVGLLEDQGPSLGFPRSSSVRGSKCKQLRELRIQIDGNPNRVLYAFDSRRIAVLLIGGNKGSDDRWYRKTIPKAEKLLHEHLVKQSKQAGD